MNKILSPQSAEAILNTVYQTNISARDYDLVKLFISKLPEETLQVEEQTKGR